MNIRAEGKAFKTSSRSFDYMSDQRMTKDVNGPVKVKTCEWFEHKLGPHIHQCLNKTNKSNRCGYDVSDLNTCPLVGKIVEKDIRPSKPLIAVDSKSKVLTKPDKLSLGPGLKLDQKSETVKTKPESTAPDVQKSGQTVAPLKGGSSHLSNGVDTGKIKPETSPVKIPPVLMANKKDILDKADSIEEKSEHQIDHQEALGTVIAEELKVVKKSKVAKPKGA
jgi:hypothetical protein